MTLAIGLALCDDLQGMFCSDVGCFDASDSCLHELGWYVRFRNKDTDSSPVSDLQVVATGILYLVQLSAASPFANTNLNWTIPYISISLGLNILITIAIVLRLLLFRRRIASVLGTTHGAQYTSVAAMIVESASLYSIFSILLLVPFALGSPVASVFLQVIGQIQGCATLLIVLRVAAGKAWSSDTKQTFSSMQSPSVQMSTFRVANFPQDGSFTTGDSRTNGPFPCSDFKSTSSGTICAVNGLTIIKDNNAQPPDVDSPNGAYDRV